MFRPAEVKLHVEVTAIVLVLVAVGGANVFRTIAARKLSRDQRDGFWPAFAMGFTRARVCGVPAGILVFGWFFLFGFMALVAWLS